MNMESNENGREYFDYKEKVDEIFDIKFDVKDEYIVNSKASIKVTFTSKKEYFNIYFT